MDGFKPGVKVIMSFHTIPLAFSSLSLPALLLFICPFPSILSPLCAFRFLFPNFSLPSLPQFTPLPLLLCHVSIRQLSAVHVRVRRTVKQTQGSSENQSLRELEHTHTP